MLFWRCIRPWSLRVERSGAANEVRRSQSIFFEQTVSQCKKPRLVQDGAFFLTLMPGPGLLFNIFPVNQRPVTADSR